MKEIKNSQKHNKEFKGKFFKYCRFVSSLCKQIFRYYEFHVPSKRWYQIKVFSVFVNKVWYFRLIHLFKYWFYPSNKLNKHSLFTQTTTFNITHSKCVHNLCKVCNYQNQQMRAITWKWRYHHHLYPERTVYRQEKFGMGVLPLQLKINSCFKSVVSKHTHSWCYVLSWHVGLSRNLSFEVLILTLRGESVTSKPVLKYWYKLVWYKLVFINKIKY